MSHDDKRIEKLTYMKATPDFILEMDELQKEETFRQVRQELYRAANQAKMMSRRHAAKFVEDDRRFWASVLFTKLSVKATTLHTIFPKRDKKAHWDFSSFATLTRSLIETYLMFYWLCVEEINEDEWELRRVSLYLFDFKSRWRMINGDLQLDEEQPAYRDLLERFFRVTQKLGTEKEKRQKILRSKGMPFLQDDILEKMGVKRDGFRSIYRFLSEHVHAGPVSFYRMAEHGRGTGVRNAVDRDYYLSITPAAIWALTSASDEFEFLFEKA